jgi:hypothetical protein
MRCTQRLVLVQVLAVTVLSHVLVLRRWPANHGWQQIGLTEPGRKVAEARPASPAQQLQSSPCQALAPSLTATAAIASPIAGSSHQPAAQMVVMASTNSTAAACAAHR